MFTHTRKHKRHTGIFGRDYLKPKTMTLTQLQIEVAEWSQRNFPNNKPHHPLLGAVEEVGELEEAETHELMEDAIADIIIYLADYCGRNGLKMEILAGPLTGNIGKELARLCHYHLKGEQGIRYAPADLQNLKQKQIGEVLRQVFSYGSRRAILALDCAERVWAKVKTRDWQKNPIDAAQIAGVVK